MRFAEGMGKKREDVKNTVAIKETKELVDNFMKLTKDERYHVGFSALYCYESMIHHAADVWRGIRFVEAAQIRRWRVHRGEWHCSTCKVREASHTGPELHRRHGPIRARSQPQQLQRGDGRGSARWRGV